MRNSPWPWFSCEDQHGREGAVLRQHLRGADGEVRGGVPESLRQRPGGQERAGDYFIAGSTSEEELKEKRYPDQPVLVSYGRVQEFHLIVA